MNNNKNNIEHFKVWNWTNSNNNSERKT